MDRARMVAGNHEAGTPVPRAFAAAGMGALACGALSMMLAKIVGVSPSLAALGGAMLGGVGAFAAVAQRKIMDDSPFEDEEPGASVWASYLIQHLGTDLTAYLTGVDEQIQVQRWATGDLEPGPLPLSRLRSGYKAAHEIVRAYGGETAQSWFSGMNPWLDDEAPAYVLRHSNEPDAWESVVEAAEEFVEFEH